MRRRLLLSTLASVAAAVLLLGAPLAVAVRGLLVQQALDELEQLAEGTEAVLDQGIVQAELLLGLLAERSATRLMVLSTSGEVVLDSGGGPSGRLAGGPDVARARQGQVGRARGDGLLSVAVPIDRPGAQAILRATATDERLGQAVRRAWLQIAGLALLAVAVAALLARWQGERLAAPLEALAASARRLGEGDFSARAPRSGVPEADEVASTLDRTAGRLSSMLERSRSFGADASHQLRTPLTALRLDLEALEATIADGRAAGAPELVTAAMVEADRLEATIDELLALADAPGDTDRVDLGALVTERLDAWQALARAEQRRVVVQQGVAPPVRARAAAIGQSLQVLLDNALAHGQGTITVVIEGVERRAGQEQAGARLCVADEGPGLPPEVAALVTGDTPGARRGREGDHGGGSDGPADGRSDGRGLALARSLIEAEGGRLRVARRDSGAMVCLLLPAAPPA